MFEAIAERDQCLHELRDLGGRRPGSKARRRIRSAPASPSIESPSMRRNTIASFTTTKSVSFVSLSGRRRIASAVFFIKSESNSRCRQSEG